MTSTTPLYCYVNAATALLLCRWCSEVGPIGRSLARRLCGSTSTASSVEQLTFHIRLMWLSRKSSFTRLEVTGCEVVVVGSSVQCVVLCVYVLCTGVIYWNTVQSTYILGVVVVVEVLTSSSASATVGSSTIRTSNPSPLLPSPPLPSPPLLHLPPLFSAPSPPLPSPSTAMLMFQASKTRSTFYPADTRRKTGAYSYLL